MQLRNARLCLDCEEVHDEPQCPVCASESFAFIKRWVQAGERRARPRESSDSEAAETYRALLEPNGQPRLRTWQLVRGGAVGLAILGAAGWMWRRGAAAGTDADADGEARNGGETKNEEPGTKDAATRN